MRYIKNSEYKYLILLMLSTIAFSIWFYLDLTTQERFALTHGYGVVSQTKEVIGILGISLAFITSLIYHRIKKAKATLLLSTGLGLLVVRSILHSTHMVNSMELNPLLWESLFEGENHFIQSILDVAGALILSWGMIRLAGLERFKKILGSVLLMETGLLALIMSKTSSDMESLLNNLVVSHGQTLLPTTMAAMPIIAFSLLTFIAYQAYAEKDSDFYRLLFIGFGFIFLRSLVHGIHTVFGAETHFFQSGFDLLGGAILGVGFYKEISKEKNPSTNIWLLAGMFLAFAITYWIFAFFKIR